MMNSIEYWLKFDLMSYNKTVNDFEFRWIQGGLGEYHVPWVDQSLYSPHGKSLIVIWACMINKNIQIIFAMRQNKLLKSI